MSDVIRDRRKTHGEWSRTAKVAQALRRELRNQMSMRQQHDGLPYLSDEQAEALDMILAKIARIVSGDSDHADHWLDIAGYARLALGEDREP